MKADFTEKERNLINIICTLYKIQIITDKNGVFRGLIPSKTRLTLNGTYLMQLLTTSNVVYIEGRSGGSNILTIVAQ